MIELPAAFHCATDDLPFADDWADAPGIRRKLLMADIEGARFAVRIRFAPGILLPPHEHTGEVLAVGDAESHLRDYPAALRAQGKPVPAELPIGGAMKYRAVP